MSIIPLIILHPPTEEVHQSLFMLHERRKKWLCNRWEYRFFRKFKINRIVTRHESIAMECMATSPIAHVVWTAHEYIYEENNRSCAIAKKMGHSLCLGNSGNKGKLTKPLLICAASSQVKGRQTRNVAFSLFRLRLIYTTSSGVV